MNDWQPIETASKDGTRILAWFPFEDDAYVTRWTKNVYEDAMNWTLDGGESARLKFDPPTHWMPIPERPK
jgi:hypothetical protein